MLFNSIDFAIFLPIVFLLYWFIAQKNLTIQNTLIVVSSYVFYGWWDWRFLSLILISTTVDYIIGRQLRIEQKLGKRKALLWISILVNLGFLGFFKYYNFFLESFISAFSLLGAEIQAQTLNIILPVGISFYTFQTLSYTIDVYNKKLEATKDFIAFAAFVSFFPQLVAGPIARATDVLPQFLNKRTFIYSKAVDGMRQILWGLFKKVVIADNCAEFANHIFKNSADMNGSTLLLGVLFFSIQIYCDFSGYSDIAIGTSRIFGFNLKQNFATPYFSKNIVEFWRRWHISLTSWLTDYVFTPLALKLRYFGKKGILISITVTFVLSGLWHGAGWNFIVYGLLHATYYLVTLFVVEHKKLFKKNDSIYEIIPSLKDSINMLLTFILVSFSYIFFRAENLGDAFNYIGGICSYDILSLPMLDPIGEKKALTIVFLSMIFICVEWLGRKNRFALEDLKTQSKPIRWTVYILMIISIHLFRPLNMIEFIYFQF